MRASFFNTDRGITAVQHALEIARTHLAASARMLRFTVRTPFDRLLQISLDHSVTLKDDRLPGGTVTGKVVAYRLYMDGDSGKSYAEATIAVPLFGDSKGRISAKPDPKSYARSGYCAPTYQVRQRLLKTKTGIRYCSWFDQQPKEGVVHPYALKPSDIVRDIRVKNTSDEQNKYLQKNQYPKRQNPLELLKENPTTIKVSMLDMNARDVIDHEINLDIPAPWMLPKS